jgi:hypothetical protein
MQSLWGRGEEQRKKNPDAPQLFKLLLLDVINALTPLLGLLFEAPALFKDSNSVLHLLLLVLTHLPTELIGML